MDSPEYWSFPPERWRPAQAEGVGTVVVFALGWILFAAEIKAENFIRKIEERSDHLKIMGVRQVIHHLCVHLGVRIEVDVPEWPFYATRRAVCELVGENIRVVV